MRVEINIMGRRNDVFIIIRFKRALETDNEGAEELFSSLQTLIIEVVKNLDGKTIQLRRFKCFIKVI